jgi:pyruvate formate lyase activating enzyme
MARGDATVSVGAGCITSLAVDPIEKKPLARFHPGSTILSLGSFGCNLHCPWCQNHAISQVGIDGVQWRRIAPAEIADLARRLSDQDPSMIGVAYTYNEPLVDYEYLLDCASLVRQEGLRNVLVSAGCVGGAVVDAVAPLIDAANIDYKGATQATYDRCAGDLGEARYSIEALHAAGCHVEVTTLVVPGVNDSEDEIDAIAAWIARVDPRICYHVSRFHGAWRMSGVPPTRVDVVYRLAEVARRHLTHVYTGNC